MVGWFGLVDGGGVSSLVLSRRDQALIVSCRY